MESKMTLQEYVNKITELAKIVSERRDKELKSFVKRIKSQNKNSPYGKFTPAKNANPS